MMKRKKLLIAMGIILALIILPIGGGAFYLDMKLNQMIVDDEANEEFSSDNLRTNFIKG